MKPAKPILASVAAIPAGGTLPTKIRELIAVAKDSGAKENVDGNVPGFSERNTRRIRDKLRLEPAPRGRPRKKRK